jgi:CTP synthase
VKTSTKYIFVTGGVVSSLGKGIVSASLAVLLQARGYSVTIQKYDPYINIDPGTMNPYEHGEVFVTEDGAETDLDLGHYERFLGIHTSQANNVTAGRVYQTVIANERKGYYGGKTVQVVPHITDEIKRRFQVLGQTGNYDIVITEIGGTVGDIESLPFLEAARQLHYELGKNATLFLHLTLVPYVKTAGELKTKPTQHSVKQLLELGIQPQVLVCRVDRKLSKEVKAKIALFCNVPLSNVIEALDASTIYEVPLLLKKEKLDKVILEELNLAAKQEPELQRWKVFLDRLKNPIEEVEVGLVGKYAELLDAYKSIYESFIHAGAAQEIGVKVLPIHSEDIQEENVERLLGNLDGILVGPGFGGRGISGKIIAVRYAREKKIPFLGICLGMQMACIEFGRNVLHLEDCNTAEIQPTCQNPVIHLMEEQKNQTDLGGTMRLGAYPCKIKKETLAYSIYQQELITERHRHRYEFNNAYIPAFESHGFCFSGMNPEQNLVEIIELKDHPFFIGCQFHPEYKSKALMPHPLYVAFVKAMEAFKKKTKI